MHLFIVPQVFHTVIESIAFEFLSNVCTVSQNNKQLALIYTVCTAAAAAAAVYSRF